MSGIDPRAIISAIGGSMLIIAALFAFSTYNRLLRGEITLAEALEPWWKDIAVAYPTAFGILLVLGFLIFGSAFRALVEA